MISAISQLSGKAAANLRDRNSVNPKSSVHAAQRLARAYAMWWLASLFAITTIISLTTTHPSVARLIGYPFYDVSMADKLAYYRQHKTEFDLILLGDSLTYTGLHPEFVDPALGTRSINMAHFANWLATQYPLIQDIVPVIPHGTRVLWSVHLYDFNDAGLSIQHVYPVGVLNAFRYWAWNAPNPGLVDNVLYYNPLTSFFVKTDELRERVMQRGAKPVTLPGIAARALANPTASAQAESSQLRHDPFFDNSPATEATFPAAPQFISLQNHTLRESEALKDRLIEYYSRFPSVAAVSPVSDRGQINSVILYLKRGGYYRIELVPEYFREKQREMAQSQWHLDDQAAENYTPPPLGPVSLKMFEAGLAAFRNAGVPVTVNAMEEAPFTFPNEIVRKKYRRLVDQTLQPIVRRYGDDYIHADYNSITDSDYFDYNHFNSSGIAKYTPLLVNALRRTRAFSRMAQH